MRRFITAVAGIALVTSGAYAQGNGRGGGHGGGHGGGQSTEQRGGGGGGNGNANRGSGDDGRGGVSMASSQNDRGNGGGNAMREDRGNGGGNGNAMRDDRGGNSDGNGNADRGNSGNQRAGNDNRGGGNDNANRGGGNDRADNGNRGRGNDRADNGNGGRGRSNDDRTLVVDDRGRGNLRDVDVVHVNRFSEISPRGLIDGCPPGLAKKNPPCMPPGQVRSNIWDRPDFWGLNSLGDGRYFYDDGYLVRYAPAGGILGYVPLLGGALSLGNVWPSYYQPVALPNYYESYYGLGPYDSYRYADNVIYRVDPETAAITSIAALLTGDQFTVGQPMPLGYDVYNVPYPYRNQYVDGPGSNYRYADGYVYQVDPETRLIAAAIELLAS